MSETAQRSISLVLGSGGARGLAHIGVIHWLEENDFKIDSISGCSMGALVGGIYAAGKLDAFEKWVRTVNKFGIISMLDIAWGMSGLIRGEKIINTLVKLVGDQKIEELPINYTAVAADIRGEKEVWIRSGSLFDAIRASISIPLFFTPFRYNGVDLIDGGVLNPVPIAPTFGDHTEMIIAVNVGSAMDTKEELKDVHPESVEEPVSFFDKLTRFFDSSQQNEAKSRQREWGAYDITTQAFDAMQSTIARQKLAAYPPDHIIEISRHACGTLEFDRASEMIDLGYSKAEEFLAPKLKR
ncbi:patatin-like phospholipase family protein [Porifericola rhodea]|uniref:patatin-like phospholipase family protein n=1 Tax=Porifericola rhodea TaxID=930972 RepID=UPI002667194B|nr:patatin-like phospholipase family protein [Porifericola rhodea]WKN30146.1 patatin-like phospholipase family protein [Porifericola rhodea]